VPLAPTVPRSSLGTPFVSYSDEIGFPRLYIYKPLLVRGSGRLYAWDFAIGQSLHRPLLGYGFGTELAVFKDRFFYYQAAYTENSFVGMFLQLGAIGVVLLLFPFVLCVVWGTRSLRSRVGLDREAAAVTMGMAMAALVAGLFQSYLYSAGNLGALTAWTGVALAAAVVGSRRPVAA
jgi:O-antigen ligase